MATVSLDTTELRDLGKAYQKVGASLLDGGRKVLFPVLNDAKNDMRRLVSGPVLRVRTGILRNSMTTEGPTVHGQQLEGRAGLLTDGPASKYGHFLVRGGTITPKRGKYLAIPIGPALTGSGAARFPGGPRTVDGLVFIPRTRAGNTILALISGRGKARKLTPYFVLKRSVTIRPHDYISEPAARATTQAQAAFAQYLSKIVASA